MYERPRLLVTTLVLLGTSQGLDLSPLGVRGTHLALTGVMGLSYFLWCPADEKGMKGAEK
jgi:hypothetical protein